MKAISIKYCLITIRFLLISFVIDSSSAYAQVEVSTNNSIENYHEVYVIKSYWHTGFILTVDEKLLNFIPPLKKFKDYKYVDIGWGDEDFYQNPSDFDLYLASKAILFPTNSVIRVHGYNFPIENIINWSDYCIVFKLLDTAFVDLCDYLEESFERSVDNETLIASIKAGGGIIFFHSTEKYHLYNTCNTWIASALENSGFDISPSFVITARDLFNEIKDFGTVLKQEE